MKNFKNIVIVILSVLLIASVVVNLVQFNNTSEVEVTNSDIEVTASEEIETTKPYIIGGSLEDYLNYVNLRIIEDNYDVYSECSEDIACHTGMDVECLAALVSNKDFTPKFVDIIAKIHNYGGYRDMVERLVEADLLVYIPTYIDAEGDVIGETVVTPYTVGYERAVEAGVIDPIA